MFLIKKFFFFVRKMVNFGKMNRLLGYRKFKDEIEKDDKIQNNIVEKGCERNIKRIFFKVCLITFCCFRFFNKS